MKKVILISVSAILLAQVPCFSQIPYYDAILLKDSIPKTSQDTTKIKYFSGIIKKYLPDGWKDSSANAIFKSLIDQNTNYNPFLYKLISEAANGVKTNEKLKIYQSDKLPDLLPGNVSNFDVTNLAQGISLFLIDRAKQELNIVFFSRLKSFFNGHKEVQALFPKTSVVLENLLDYRYPEMLPTLQSAICYDLKTFPQHIDDVFNLPIYKPLIEKFPELLLLTKSIQLVDRFQKGEVHPADIIKEFAELKIWTNGNSCLQNMGNSIRLANIFSQSLRDTAKDGGWVKSTDWEKLLSDSIPFKIYAGLVYQLVKNEEICFSIYGNNKKDSTYFFNDIMKQYKERIYFIQNVVEILIENSNRLATVYKEIKAKKDSGSVLTDDDYCRYISSGIGIVKKFGEIAQKFIPDLDYGNYFKITDDGMEIYRFVYEKQYGYAIVNGMNLLKGAIDSINNDTLKTFLKIMPQITKYGIFMANIVDAKTPEDVEKVIETVALPVGSSAIKKNSCFNICIQSYLGAFTGIDNALIEKNNQPWKQRFGVIAPIGIAASLGLNKWGSISAFGSLLDVGAIVDYDLTKDTTASTIKKDYKVDLGQIFSPGLYFAYGFPWNLPLTLGIGGQYGPGLSKITPNGETVINNPDLRFNVFIGVDIPLLNIINVGKDM